MHGQCSKLNMRSIDRCDCCGVEYVKMIYVKSWSIGDKSLTGKTPANY